VTVAGVAGLILLGATSAKAQAADTGMVPTPAEAPDETSAETPGAVPTASPAAAPDTSAPGAPLPLPPTGAMRTMGQGKGFSMPSGDDPGGMAGRGDEAFVKCEGCSVVSAPLMKQGAEVLKYLTEKQTLPPSLVRLSSAEIDALLRGKSWTSAVIAGPFGKEYQRLLAFDTDGRGRWLNFHGGIKGYSTLCRYEVDEDLLCRSCAVGPAQCSAVYRKGDLVMAYDEEQGQLEIYDWIMKSRWEDDRFLAPH
jgi:hypothetical protein